MSKLSISEHFDCTQDHAFNVVTDFPNAPKYISGIIKTEMLTKGPVGLKTRVRETREMFGREATEEMEITDWDRPNRAVIEAHSHGARYISTYTVVAEGTGSKVSMTFEALPQTLMAKVMSFVMSGLANSLEKMMLKDLSDAKIYAEGNAEKAE